MRYQINLSRTDVTYLTVEVEAASIDDAEQAAERMLRDSRFEPDEDDEDVCLGDWKVEEVVPVPRRADPPSEG